MNHATIVHEAGAETTTVTGFASVEVLEVEPDNDGLAHLRVEYTDSERDGETFHRAFVEDAYGGVMSSLHAVVGESYAAAFDDVTGQALIPPMDGEPDPSEAEGPVEFVGVTFAKRVISAEKGPRVVLVSEEDFHVIHPADAPFDVDETTPREELPGNQDRAGPDILALRGTTQDDLEVSLDASLDDAIDEALAGGDAGGDGGTSGDEDAFDVDIDGPEGPDAPFDG